MVPLVGLKNKCFAKKIDRGKRIILRVDATSNVTVCCIWGTAEQHNSRRFGEIS